jgi:hypothetical protein
LPLFSIVTRPEYPNVQLPLTLTVAAKEGAGAVVVRTVAAGDGLAVGLLDAGTPVEVGRRDAGAAAEATGDRDADEETGTDGVGDDETALDTARTGEGDTEDGVADGSTATCGIEGSTTVGCRDASAGPTARTASHTTKRTRIATAKLMNIRAVLKGREECFAGNGRPSGDQHDWGGRLPRYAMPLARRPSARLISFCASRAAMSCRLS